MAGTYMPQKLAALGFSLMILLAGFAIGGAGLAAAQDAGNATTLASETMDVDDNTQSVQAIAENATGTLDVYVFGVDNETETQVASGTLDATGNTTDTYEYSSLDPDAYSQYKVNVTTDSGEAADNIEISRVQVQPGGGGFAGSGITIQQAVLGGIAVVLVLGLAAWRAN